MKARQTSQAAFSSVSVAADKTSGKQFYRKRRSADKLDNVVAESQEYLNSRKRSQAKKSEIDRPAAKNDGDRTHNHSSVGDMEGVEQTSPNDVNLQNESQRPKSIEDMARNITMED